MKNQNRTSNLNFNVQSFWKSKKHLILCFMSQLQYRNENQNFIPISYFNLSIKWNDTLGYTDFSASSFLALFRILEKNNSGKSKHFFLHNIIRYAFELFTLVLLSTHGFVNIQNNLKWIKAIENNLLLTKFCHRKEVLFHFEVFYIAWALSLYSQEKKSMVVNTLQFRLSNNQLQNPTSTVADLYSSRLALKQLKQVVRCVVTCLWCAVAYLGIYLQLSLKRNWVRIWNTRSRVFHRQSSRRK